MATLDQARSAQAELKTLLSGLAGINGIGLARNGDNGWCLRVNLLRGHEAQESHIPTTINGVPVSTRKVGLAKAQ